MRFLLTFALIISILVCIFALQNTMPVLVDFLFWSYEGALAFVVLMTFAAGIVLGLGVSLPGLVKRGRVISRQRKYINKLAQEMKTAEVPEIQEMQYQEH